MRKKSETPVETTETEKTPATSGNKIERRAPKPEELTEGQRWLYDQLSDELKAAFLEKAIAPVVIDVGTRDAKISALDANAATMQRIIDAATARMERSKSLITQLQDGLDPASIDLRKEAVMPEADGVQIRSLRPRNGGKESDGGTLPLS